MTIHFHPPEDGAAYAEKVLSILLQAALPQVQEQLNHLLQEEARKRTVPGTQQAASEF